MLSNPTAAQTIRYVREALEKTIAPELQSDKAKVLMAMIQGTLAAVERRIPVEQQYMADECGRMRAFVASAAYRCSGVPGHSADELANLAAALPGGEFPALPSFAEVNATYKQVSDLFTQALGTLHDLSAQGVSQAPDLIDEARGYIALRLQRDNLVFGMDGGLIGK